VGYLIAYNRYCNLLGIAVIIAIAWLCSRKRSSVDWKLIINALILQVCIAFVVLRTRSGHYLVAQLAEGIKKLYEYADVGSAFVFGSLCDSSGPWGFVFACKVLPVIVFFGALMALLFHWGVVQRVVACVGLLVRPLLGTSGAETVCAVANSFLGQTEAPLLIRAYLKDMTRSEFLVVMISGMGTISGAILAVFAAMGVPALHLLTSSVMSIPGTILISKILYPETEKAETGSVDQLKVGISDRSQNLFSAISAGTTEGLFLALNVGAMLVSFLALIALVNSLLTVFSIFLGSLIAFLGIDLQIPALSLNFLFSYIFAPFGYLLGFTGSEALLVGQLLGTKVAVNELVAYGQMVSMDLSDRTVAIVTYALCGFSNFSCIGIQIGGIGALVPEKRQWICEFGLLAVLGGALSNLLCAMIAGLLL
jgi:concentrative nucleoside transporter, CNT family